MNDVTVKRELDRRGLCHQDEHSDLWAAFLADTPLERRPARNLCGQWGKETSCPVRELCLKWALEHGEIWGIWGGCDESEIRRALWVNADGDFAPRSRFPNCPNCKARPNKLYVLAMCDIKTGRSREQVACERCDFTWKSGTSVRAVRAYWRDRQRKIRARAIKARIPSDRQRRSVIQLPMSAAVTTATTSEVPVSLVASGE